MQAEILVHFLHGQMMQECSQADAGAGHRVRVVDVKDFYHASDASCRRMSLTLILSWEMQRQADFDKEIQRLQSPPRSQCQSLEPASSQ